MGRRLRSSTGDVWYCLAESFLYAGSSAIMLSISRIYPELWFISLFALVPFLWRAVDTTLTGSVGLGVLLASSYCLATIPIGHDNILGVLSRLAVLNILLVLYAVSVNRASKFVGFNAVLIALLWLPVEHLLGNYAGLSLSHALSESDSSLIIRLGSLFGMLIVSFAIVLLNSLLLIAIESIADSSRSSRFLGTEPDEIALLALEEDIPPRFWRSNPVPRGPPSPLAFYV